MKTNTMTIIKSLISVNAEIRNLKDLEGWVNGLTFLGPVDVKVLFIVYNNELLKQKEKKLLLQCSTILERLKI